MTLRHRLSPAGRTWQPSGTAWFSVLAGVSVALVVALVSLPLLREARVADQESQARFLELVASFTASQVREGSLPRSGQKPGATMAGTLEQLQVLTGVDRLAILDTDFEELASAGGADTIPGFPSDSQILEYCDGDDVLAGEVHSTTARVSPGGLGWMAACVPLPVPTGQVGGLVLSAVESPDILRLRRLERRLWIQVSLGAALAMLAVTLGLQWLLRPLRDLAAAASSMAQGRRGLRVEPRGPREVRRLAWTLNSLASAVERREEEAVSRLQAVGRFARMVAHEIRNPLQSLALLTDLAMNETDDLARGEHLRSIDTEIRGMERLVQRFLRSPGTVEPSPVQLDLRQLVEETCR